MTIARNRIVDIALTRFYACDSWCVRQVPLFGGIHEYRKQWIEDRLKELADAFAIGVCAYTVLDNHFQVLVRLDPEKADAWSNAEIIRRWLLVWDMRDSRGKVMTNKKEWLNTYANDPVFLEEARARLANLGWFMKSLREPISRRINNEESCGGAMWESRYQSVAVLDELSALAACAAIDLCPFVKGAARSAETSECTSLKTRIEQCVADGRLDKLREASPTTSKVNFEKGGWLLPIEDRRDSQGKGTTGMLKGISLAGYTQLLEWSSRILRPGKSKTMPPMPSVLASMKIDPNEWRVALTKLTTGEKKYGSYFGSRDRLQELASERGCKFVKNVTGWESSLAGVNGSSQSH